MLKRLSRVKCFVEYTYIEKLVDFGVYDRVPSVLENPGKPWNFFAVLENPGKPWNLMKNCFETWKTLEFYC